MKGKDFLEFELKDKIDDLNIIVREIYCGKQRFYLTFLLEISNRERISEAVIKPLNLYRNNDTLTISDLVNRVIHLDDCRIKKYDEKLVDYMMSGFSLLFTDEQDDYLVLNTIMIDKRSVNTPEIENSLRCPKDAFNENYWTNLSLIRYRIKDKNLKIKEFFVGRRTKTLIAMLYIGDVANEKIIEYVEETLNSIDIDGIITSGEIQKFLGKSKTDIFPQSGIIENSSTACDELLKGKICLVIDGSNIVITVPKIFNEFLSTPDDYSDSIYLTFLSMILRYSSVIISLTASSLYLCVVSFNPDFVPERFIVALSAAKQTVPFNTAVEILGMEFISEVLREASIRLPKQIGSAIGIVGTIVIGNAAVSAGLVSPVMVIIVSIEILCSFVTPDYTIINPVRVFKFFLILVSAFFGLFGFCFGITIFTLELISTTTATVPSIRIFSPLNLDELKMHLFRERGYEKYRPEYLKTKDKRKQK